MNFYPADSIILAPLSGYTDLPYRRSMRRFGCDFAFTEMIDAGSLAHCNPKTDKMLERGGDEAWLGVQLVGSNPERICRAVAVINRHEFDVLDFNLGCPAPKVVKKGAGAALGQKVDQALRIFGMVTKSSRFPVTAKIRILDEIDSSPTVRLVEGLLDNGARAVTIHGRLRRAFYSGPVFSEIISAVRQAVKVQIVANGGVTGYASFSDLRHASGCDCVMVARGAMGNPWLFQELKQGDRYQPPTSGELAAEMATHIYDMIDYYGEALALRIGRKIILDYLRGRGFASALKERVSTLRATADFLELIKLVEAGSSERYRQWIRNNPNGDRRLQLHPVPPEPCMTVSPAPSATVSR